MDAKTLCLGALMHQDASGYEIRKMYEEGPFSCFHAVSFGSIYPALNQMLADGLVTVREMVQEGRPDKKVYAITERGRDAFIRGLNTEPAPDRFRSDMLYILAFGHLLAPDYRTALLDGYVAGYRQMIDDINAAAADCGDVPPGRRFVRDFGLAIYEAVVRYIAENRHILETAEAERAPAHEETP